MSKENSQSDWELKKQLDLIKGQYDSFTEIINKFKNSLEPEDVAKDYDQLSTLVRDFEKSFQEIGNLLETSNSLKETVQQVENTVLTKGDYYLKEVELRQTLDSSVALNEKLIESETRLKEAQEIAKLARWEFLVGKRTFIWSKEMYELYGEDGESGLLNKEDPLSIIHPEDREKLMEQGKLAIISKKDFEFDIRVNKKDGTVAWVVGKGKPVINDNGKLLKYVGIAMDISERKNAELSIKRSEQLFKALIQNSSDFVHLTDHKGEITYESPAVEKILGYDSGEIFGKNIFDLFHPEDISNSKKIFETLKASSGKNMLYEVRIRHKKGHWVWMESLGTNLLSDPSVQAIVFNNRDITERKSAQEEIDRLLKETQVINHELRSSEEEIRQTLENSIELNQKLVESQEQLKEAQQIAKLGRWEFDFKKEEIYWSEEVYKIFGVHDFFIKVNEDFYLEKVYPEFRANVNYIIQEASQFGKGFKQEVKIKTSNGDKWIYMIGKPLIDNMGSVVKLVIVVLDITERKHAEIALQKNEKLFRQLIENSQDGIFLLDAGMRVIYASPSSSKILGYKVHEILDQPEGISFVHPDYQEYVHNRYLTLASNPGSVIKVVYLSEHKDGSWKWIENTAKNLLNDPDINSIVINSRDITEQKAAEEALKESERKYRMLMEEASDGILVSNSEEKYISVNNRGCQMLGYSQEELLGLSVYDVISKEEDAIYAFNLEELNQGKSILAERFMKRKDGSIFPVEISAKKLNDNTYQTFVRDITERRKSEELIKRSEAELNALFHALPDLIIVFNKAGEFLKISSNIPDLYYPPGNDLIGKNIFEVLPDIEALHINKYIQQALAGSDEVVQTEYSIDYNGRKVWFSATVSPMPDDKVVWVARDTTQRKRAEQELLNSKNYLDKIINTIPEPVFVKDQNHKWILLNEALCEYLGHSPQGLLGKSDFDFFPEDKAKNFWERDEVVLQTGEDDIMEEELFDYRGFKRTLIIKKSLYDDPQRGKLLVGIINDITARKSIEKKLQNQNEELTKINAELDKFVYRASHDLRAPLVSILGLINIAKMENNLDKNIHYFDLMEKSINKLDNFIQGIIHYSRNSRLELLVEKIEIDKLVSDTFDDLKYNEASQNLSLKVNVEGKEEFYSDLFRLKIIFNNIISNAIRYSNPRQQNPYLNINILINKDKVVLEFADNGIGIAEDYISRIFEMFYRASESNVGSGLGLYIVKDVVETMKGNIQVESVLGEGTKFIIEVPNLKRV